MGSGQWAVERATVGLGPKRTSATAAFIAGPRWKELPCPARARRCGGLGGASSICPSVLFVPPPLHASSSTPPHWAPPPPPPPGQQHHHHHRDGLGRSTCSPGAWAAAAKSAPGSGWVRHGAGSCRGGPKLLRKYGVVEQRPMHCTSRFSPESFSAPGARPSTAPAWPRRGLDPAWLRWFLTNARVQHGQRPSTSTAAALRASRHRQPFVIGLGCRGRPSPQHRLRLGHFSHPLLLPAL